MGVNIAAGAGGGGGRETRQALEVVGVSRAVGWTECGTWPLLGLGSGGNKMHKLCG